MMKKENDKNKNAGTGPLDSPCTCGECHCGDEKTAELEEQLKRTMADFINYKRRNEDAYKAAVLSGVGTAVNALLPSLDAIEAAEKMYKDEVIKRGLRDVMANFEKSLASLGIKKIKALGEEFNPELHNAVLREEKKGVKTGVITEELQAGYIMADKVIRYSVVKVSK